MDELSVQDARTIYEGCLFMYQGRPFLIEAVEGGVNHHTVVGGFTDEDFKQIAVPLIQADFSAPERVGYFNYGGVAYYTKRYPLRRYRGGICSENTQVGHNGYVKGGRYHSEPPIRSKEFAIAVIVNYPSLFKAWTYAKDIPQEHINEGYYRCFAFDKQFAIDSNRRIYFCGNVVGEVPKGRVRIENIVFRPGKEYLMAALIGDYNETARILGIKKN